MNGTTIKQIGLGVLLWSALKNDKAALSGVAQSMIKAAVPFALDGIFRSGGLGAPNDEEDAKPDGQLLIKLLISAGLLLLIWRKGSTAALGNSSTEELPDGERAPDALTARKVTVSNLKDRLKLIADLIRKGKQNPDIRKLAGEILHAANTPGKDWQGEVTAIFAYVHDNIRYTRDVAGLDTYQRSVRTLEMKIGDCDDMAILLSALLGAIGYPIRLKVVSISGGDWDHIYPLVGMPPFRPETWMALDASIDNPMGDELPYKREAIFEVT